MKYCTNCGEALINLSKFCRECGQKIDHDGNLKPKKEDIESPYFIPVEVFDNGSKWGTIDTKGNWVIQPQLDTIYRFDENGMADAEINEKWGVIDTKGNWVIQPQFDSFFIFEKGMANAEINEKWGMIDTKGNWVIQPQFDDLIQFDEIGMALVKINEKWGMIDTKGNWVIQPQFDSLGSFNDGLAPASTDLEKIGFIDTKGNWVIQPKFDYFYDFDEYPNGFDENGFSIACINDKYGLINKKGDWVIDSKYDRISLMYENHSSMYENQITYYKVHSDGKVGFIGGSNLNLNIPLIFEDADLLKSKWFDQQYEEEDSEIGTGGIIDPELFLSTFVDNETTFLGHEDITNALNSKSQKQKDLFNEGLNDWLNDNDLEPSEIRYNFMYNHSTLGAPSILLVFSFRNEIATYILGDQRNLIKDQTWIISPWGDRSVKLQVLKENSTNAIIIINHSIENVDSLKFRIWRPKNRFFDAPWTKWKYKLTDIVAAINDACEEYNKYRV